MADWKYESVAPIASDATERAHFANAGERPFAAEVQCGQWLTPWRFGALLALLIFLRFPDVILNWRTLFDHDFTVFGYSLAHYHRECFWRGELPLWNPFNNCGLPFLAQWNTLTLYPGSLIYLLLPLPWSLNIFCLLHLFAAGLGMYFLAFRWTANRLAAGVAGLALALSAFAQCCLVWPNNVAALGWMPWVLLTLQCGWEKGRRHLVLAGVAGATQMLTGAPELILFTWSIAGVVLASEIRSRNLRALLLPAMRFFGVMILVGALAAAQLLPFLELLRHSQRNAGYGDTFYSMPVTGWANFLLPLFHCYSSRYGVYFQASQHWVASYYGGIAVVLLAALAIVKVRTARVLSLTALALFSFLIALGENGFLYPWLRKMCPALGFMNFPIKFVVPVLFCLPLLGAFGVAQWQREPRNAWRTLMLVAVLLTSMIPILIAVDASASDHGVNWRVTLENGLTRLLLLFGTVAAFYGRSRARSLRTQRFAELGALLLIGFDLLAYAPRQIPTIRPSVLQPNLERTDFPSKPAWGASRVWIDPGSHEQMATSRLKDPEAHLLTLRLMLHLNLNLLDAIPKMNGFYSIYLPHAQEVSSLCDQSGPEKAPGLFNFLSISHVPNRKGDLEWEQREGFLPAVSAGQRPIFLGANDTLRGLAATDFDPRRVVLLPREAATSVTISNESHVKILRSHFSANQVQLDVEAEQRSLVVLAQSDYPAWRARVDGEPAKLWRANYAFQALEVSAGRHRVAVTYEDGYLRCGTIISVLALIGCLAAWLCLKRRSAIE